MMIQSQAPHTPVDPMKHFRQLIYEISAEFISLPPQEIESEIDRQLKRVGEFWAFDQINLCTLTANATHLNVVHAFVKPGVQRPRPQRDVDHIPWTIEQIRQNKTICMPHIVDELPAEAELDRQHLKYEGVKSSILMPLCTGGTVQGCIFFATIHEYRDFSAELVSELGYLGQILASALERKKSWERIQEIIDFEHLLSEISATYVTIPDKNIDRVVQKDLGRLGRFLDVDRCVFYFADEIEGGFSIVDPYNWWAERDNEQVAAARAWVKDSPDEFKFQFAYCFSEWRKGRVVKFSRLEDLPADTDLLKEAHRRLHSKSWLSVPISVDGQIAGALVVGTNHQHRIWPDDLIPRLRLFGETFANVIKRKQSEENLQKAFKQIKVLKKQIEADYVYLREELQLEHHFEHIIGESQALKKVLLKVEKVAPTDSTVLILGETGTGKELIARAIHHAGRRSKRPMIKVNCATLSPNLIESELFGHEKGAFTGADSRRVGRFELADGATLFLDEIGELPLELQPKLLRVLQEGDFERLGGSRTIHADVRIIAATNRNIEKEVERGRFRSDLWYRLNPFPISVPPLRDRIEDIPLFVNWFVNKYSTKVGKRFNTLSQKNIEALKEYAWPGNIRELENIIARAVITSEPDRLQIQVPTSPALNERTKPTLKQFERNYILQMLEKTNWKIEGPNGTARLLDVKPSTLRNRMKKLNIMRPTMN